MPVRHPPSVPGVHAAGTRPIGVIFVLALALALLRGLPAGAHDGPEHEIDELTERLALQGESADLLTARALEFGILGRYPEALRDLERATELDPGSASAQRELGRLQLLTGHPQTALDTATRALGRSVAEPLERAGLHILRAEILLSLSRPRPAIDDCTAAIRLFPSNPEWYLQRSELQRRLHWHRRRLAGLEEGIARTGAGILAIERVEALLDAERYRAALERIEPELATSRVTCRWLVRRGRAHLGLGRRPAGEADLRTALRQIEELLDPLQPDALLLLDRAAALALLGEPESARRDLALARQRGASAAQTERTRLLIEMR